MAHRVGATRRSGVVDEHTAGRVRAIARPAGGRRRRRPVRLDGVDLRLGAQRDPAAVDVVDPGLQEGLGAVLQLDPAAVDPGLEDLGGVVEGELGTLAGVEDDVQVDADAASYTRPSEVYDFVTRTGVDSLAIAIGTSHGAYKFKPGQKPQLRFDILEEVGKKLPGFPIVLHGASSVNQEHIKMINEYGGEMPDAIGIPEEMLRKAASMAVCKINVDSDIRIAMTAAVRKHFSENPTHFDPRQYLTPARDLIEEVVAHKIDVVFGAAGHAND